MRRDKVGFEQSKKNGSILGVEFPQIVSIFFECSSPFSLALSGEVIIRK